MGGGSQHWLDDGIEYPRDPSHVCMALSAALTGGGSQHDPHVCLSPAALTGGGGQHGPDDSLACLHDGLSPALTGGDGQHSPYLLP